MKIGQILQWIILCFVVAATTLYLHHRRDVLSSLNNLTHGKIILLFFLVFVSFLFLAYQFRVLMRFFNIDLGIREWFGLTICNTMYGYLFPAVGGMWLRAFYLKKKYDFLYSHYANLVLGSFLLMYANACILGMVAVGLDNWLSAANHWAFLSVFVILALTVLVAWRFVLLFHSTIKTRSEKVNRFLEHFHRGMSAFKEKPRLVGQFLVFNSGFIVFNGLSYAVCLHALDAGNVTFLATIGVMALASFTKLISLTPGNLGIREMIMSLSCNYMGVPFDVALLAACITRAASMMITFILGIIYSKILMSSVSGVDAKKSWDPQPGTGAT
jgi:uncharacterized protein (TIRG00374 family)